jgi:hypothetical protein
MKRISMILVAVVTLTLLIGAYSQTRQSGNQSTQTSNDQPTKEQMAKAKAKKVLVKRLPDSLEGVELKDGIFRAKPGFEFVTQPDGTVAAARNNGGGGNIAGSFDCSCSADVPKGKCKVTTLGSAVYCSKTEVDPCNGVCSLEVTISSRNTHLAIY